MESEMRERIEETLRGYGRPVKILEVREAPQLIRYRVQPLHRELVSGKEGALTRVGQLRALVPDLRGTLGVPGVTVTVDNEGVWIETQRGVPARVYARAIPYPGGFVPSVSRGVSRGKRIPLILGIGVDSDPVIMDLGQSSTGHVLVAGTTGSGKSMLLHAMIYGLCKHTHPSHVRLIVIDTHSPQDAGLPARLSQEDGLGVWRGAPHLWDVITTPRGALDTLQAANTLITSRCETNSQWVSRYVFFIDELAELVGDRIYGEDIHQVLVSILAAGRKQGVHVVAATQRPSYDVTKGILKANFPVRVAMQVASAVDSRVALGVKGAEWLGGSGDGLLRVGMKLTRFQGGLVEDQDVEQVRRWGNLYGEGEKTLRGPREDWLVTLKRLAGME